MSSKANVKAVISKNLYYLCIKIGFRSLSHIRNNFLGYPLHNAKQDASSQNGHELDNGEEFIVAGGYPDCQVLGSITHSLQTPK